MRTNAFSRSTKRSFKITILQALTALFAVTAVAVLIIFYISASSAVLNISDRLTQEVTDNIIERTRVYLETPAKQTRAVANLIAQRDIAEIHPSLWKMMWEQLQVLPQVQAMFIGDEQGSYVQVRRIPELATRLIDRRVAEPVEQWWYRNEDYSVQRTEVKPAEYDPRIRPWYKNTPADPHITWTDIYLIRSTRTPGISPTYPLLDADGRKMGAVSISIPLHRLADFVTQQRISDNSVVFITNAENEVIAYSDGQQYVVKQDRLSQGLRLVTINELQDKRVSQAYFYYQQMQQDFVRVEGQDYLVKLAPFPQDFASQWQIVVVIPKSDLLGPVHQMMVYTVATFIIIFLIAFAVLYLIAERITHPITQLAVETAKIRNFELDHICGVQSNIREVDMMNNAILSTVKGLQSFKKYVPADLVRQLIQVGHEVNPGGEQRQLTLMFSDVAGFTSLSEYMPPQELMEHLSNYFCEMSLLIAADQGTIDKFIGDAVMAFWGAPLPVPDAPQRACHAALACQHRLRELNARWQAEGKPALRTRFGLHTGETIVGNLGSDYRVNYTAIGDSVNLTSRLEGINKLYGTEIVISAATYQQVANEFHCRLLDIVAVKGRSQGIRIYELLGTKDEVLPDWQQRFCAIYQQGVQHYLGRHWDDALDCFHQLALDFPEDKSVQLFIGRCQTLRADNALPVQWDGTAILTEK